MQQPNDLRRYQETYRRLGGSDGFRAVCERLAAIGFTKSDAARKLGVPDGTFWRWLDECDGHSIEWAPYTRSEAHRQRHAERVRNGRTSTLVDVGDGHGPSSLRQLSLRYGIAYSVIYGRYQRGWEPARLVSPTRST